MGYHFTEIKMDIYFSQTKEEVVEQRLSIAENGWSLILYNDDITPFDYVIISLVSVCKHDLIQAEQCAYIAHHKGKVVIKSGSFDEMYAMKDALSLRAIICEIDLI